jgi:hypothetical protein
MFGVFLNPDLCHLCHLCHLCLGTSCQGISSVLAYTKPLKSMQVGTCFTESNPKGPARRTRFTCLHLSPSIQSKCQDLWISNLGPLWLRSVSFVFFPRPLCPSDFVRRSCNGLWCSKRFARCSVRCGDLPFFPIRLLSFAVFSCLINTLIDLLWIVYLCRNYRMKLLYTSEKQQLFLTRLPTDPFWSFWQIWNTLVAQLSLISLPPGASQKSPNRGPSASPNELRHAETCFQHPNVDIWHIIGPFLIPPTSLAMSCP